MAAKKFFGQEIGLADPSDEPVEVVPNDDEDLPQGQCNFLYVGVGGDVVLMTENTADPVTYKNVPDGAYLWVRAVRIMEATSATDMLAHY